jgi:TetR/AcrR family transcriptional regulator
MSTPPRRRPLPDAPLPPPLRAAVPQRADATREKLLAATHELLRERVGGPVSVNEICARAGANVAMVKYCFGSKDAMIAALIERIVGGFIDELAALDARDLSATARLRIHVAEIVRNYVRYPYINRLLSTQLAEGGAEGVASLSRNFAVPARDWYRRLLAEGRKDGELRAVDPTHFFFTVIGLAEFLFTAEPLLRGFDIARIDSKFLDGYIEHVTDIVLHGVQARPAPSTAAKSRRKPR